MPLRADKPWRVVEVGNVLIVRSAPDPAHGQLGLYVAQVNWALDDARRIAEAIAALPELLVALHDILMEIEGPQQRYSTDSCLPALLVEQAEAALLKAGGVL